MRTKKILLFFIILLILLVPIPIFYIQIEDNRPIFLQAFPDGLDFNFTYIHSVEKVPVTMIYEIDGGEIILREVITTTQAAGVPFYGDSFSFSNGVMVYHSNQTTKGFLVLITRFTFQKAVVDDLEINFWQLCKDGDRVRFSIEEKPVAIFLLDTLRGYFHS